MSTTVENGQRTTAEPNLQTEYVAPEVNIFETEDGYVVEAEMPGVNKEGLEITVEGNELTIVGHRNREQVNGQPLFRERRLDRLPSFIRTRSCDRHCENLRKD